MINQKRVQKNFYLQVGDHLENDKDQSQPTFGSTACNIEIRVGAGWAVCGYYRNQILHAVTLQKTQSKQD